MNRRTNFDGEIHWRASVCPALWHTRAYKGDSTTSTPTKVVNQQVAAQSGGIAIGAGSNGNKIAITSSDPAVVNSALNFAGQVTVAALQSNVLVADNALNAVNTAEINLATSTVQRPPRVGSRIAPYNSYSAPGNTSTVTGDGMSAAGAGTPSGGVSSVTQSQYSAPVFLGVLGVAIGLLALFGRKKTA